MSDILSRLTVALADRYRLESELGAGGMATVFLAHDVRHERAVAIKVLHPDLGAALGGERFLSEIKTTARLQHPHILPLLDSGSADGLLYYVMPYVSGETLRDRITRESQLPISDALRIATEVADALATAHEAGIVHRDIKPENILLQGGVNTQHALVADFGIALAVQQAGGPRMTQTGLSLGTPQYMSPEQAMGDRTVDHRADIYALGAVTYEMLTGEPPHLGTSAQAIVAKLLTEPVRPATVLRPSVPVHVEAAVQMALAKLPADRFTTVAAFRDALRDGTGTATFRTTTAIGTLPASAPPRRGLLLAALALIAMAGGIGWWSGQRGTASARDADLPLRAPLDFEAAPAMGAAVATTITVSDDGRLIAYLGPDSNSSASGRLVLASLAEDRRQLLDVIAASSAFSPNGEWLAVSSLTGALQLFSTRTNSAPQTLLQLNGSAGIAWVTDSLLVVSSGGRLLRLELGRSSADTIPVTSPVGVGFSGVVAATSRYVVARRGPRIVEGDIGVVDLERNEFRHLGVTGSRPQYLDAGVVVYLRQGELWGLPVDPATLTPRGGERRILAATRDAAVRAYGMSRAGLVVARVGVGVAPQASRELMIVDRTGRTLYAAPERQAYRTPRFSPDGKRLVYSRATTATIGGDIFVLTPADNGVVRLTSDSVNLAPEWSPDGAFVYFARLGGARRQGRGDAEVVRVRAAGGGEPEITLRRKNQVYEFQLAPDERSILWREDVGVNTRDVLAASLDRPDSARGERASRFDERGIARSPDGAWYVYTSDETGRSEIYLSRVGGDGGRWNVSKGPGTEPRWARSGEVFFRRGDTVLVSRVELGATPTIATPRTLFAQPLYRVDHEPVWDVSADGQRLVFIRDLTTGTGTADRFVLLDRWLPRWLGSK